MKIYLAGPISGLTFAEGQSWRSYVAAKIHPHIETLSPLRAKDYLASQGILQQSYPQALSTDAGITTRDRNDVMRCDAVLFNLIAAKTVSIGTVIEFGWADAFRKPVILAIEDSGNIHDHPMVRHIVGYRTGELDKAIQIAEGILLSDRR